MSGVAVLGAGPLGAAIAHRLVERARVAGVQLIDSNPSTAAGKALDIRQAGPVVGSDTPVSGTSDVLASVGASAIVFADDTASGQWQGDAGLALARQLLRAGTRAPFVFAGAAQIWLMEAAARELGVPADRLVGTASSGVASAVAALVAVESGRTGVSVVVAGRAPALVVAWSTATVSGTPVADRVPAHRLRAISSAVPRLWPPGPLTIAAATAPVVEALIHGSRRLHHATTISAGELGSRGAAVMLAVELGRGRVLGRVLPSLSAQERTEVVNGLSRSSSSD